MKDLRILYSDNTGRRIVKEYDLIMDFTDSFEAGDMSGGHDIFAEFFENPLHHKKMNTMRELYEHCINILK